MLARLDKAEVRRRRRRVFRARSYCGPRKRVDGGCRHRASTHSPQHGEKWNTARVRRQRVLRLRGTDETNGDTENRRRLRRAAIEHFEQTKQSSRRVADRYQCAAKSILPQVERGGRAGGVKFFGELRHARIVQRANHLVLS